MVREAAERVFLYILFCGEGEGSEKQQIESVSYSAPQRKMAKSNGYGEARNQRLQENQKRMHVSTIPFLLLFLELGISTMSKSLVTMTHDEQKSKQRLPKQKLLHTEASEPRRSKRTRNPVPSYHDDLHIDLPVSKKRRTATRSSSSSWESFRSFRYIARPTEEIIFATQEERNYAFQAAEKFQRSIQSGNPSFVKSMLRSHGLPNGFCKHRLQKADRIMILEDEFKTGLSGGWRGFALHHKLNDGDEVVFELVEPAKFMVYIFRAFAALHAPNAIEVSTNKKNTTRGKSGQKIANQLSKEDIKAVVDNNDELLYQQPKGKICVRKSKNVKTNKENHSLQQERDASEKSSKSEEAPVHKNSIKEKLFYKPSKKPDPQPWSRRYT
ncbi:hypothetical protein Tsubulata_025318 [Turnera subulata]|uniref:TF-B3 domain-containing protein n=1 Tax=Turnera subulata TaxID=218843 RepID=A0A9Q0FE31_9ROSI|nr:hypothetical protein Tsubulata_025318 [Turnera subulata]